MKVVLIQECKGPGGEVKPAGTVIDDKDAHRLVDLGLAQPYEEPKPLPALEQPTEAPPAAAEEVHEPPVTGEATDGHGTGEAAAQPQIEGH